jgi:hypothetical protein
MVERERWRKDQRKRKEEGGMIYRTWELIGEAGDVGVEGANLEEQCKQ